MTVPGRCAVDDISGMIFCVKVRKGTVLNLVVRRGLLALPAWAAACVALAAAPGAQDASELARLINAYRAAPGTCTGHVSRRAAPLALEPALSSVRVGTGTFLESALEDAGYPVVRAEALNVTGPLDAAAALAFIQQRYCSALLSKEFTAMGVLRSGDEWQVVLARPRVPVRLPDWPETGMVILDAVNAARAAGRRCGGQWFAPAPPLAWNAMLGQAAYAHSLDMATHRYFRHEGSDGTVVGDRAQQAGYAWRRIGENIASGQSTPKEAVAGWLDSPGHCENIMQPGFTEMGAAYVVNPKSKIGFTYWTQVFGRPR
jgi:uncharacterized protein YkwD